MADQERTDRETEGELLRLLAENVRDYALFVVDPGGRVRSWNPGAERLLGYTEGEIVGRSAAAFFTPEDVAAGVPEQEMRQALETGRGEDDRWHVRKDGSRFWSGGVMTPLWDGDGTLRGFAKIMRDRTEWKLAQEQLHFQSRLLDAVGRAVIATDPGGTIVYWNRFAETLYGWPAADAVGRNVMDAVVPEAGAADAGEIMALLRAGRSWSGEFVVRRRDGTTFPALVTNTPLFDEAGILRAVVGVSSDITERKRAEEDLRRSEGRFRALMEQAPFSVQVFSPDGRTLRVNRAWEELWGVTLDQIADYNVLEDPQLEAKGVSPYLRRAFAGEPVAIPAIRYDPNETVPGRTRHADPRRWVSAVAYPLKDADGGVREVVLVHEDITERKRAEEALKEADRRKDEFLATLAHELRNPLAPIRNSLEILKLPGAGAATVERSRGLIERQVHHLVRLVDDLLDVSRVMRGKVELRKERVELASVVARAAETAQPLIDAQGHALTVSVPDEPLPLEADPVRLAQVLGNLLTNAAKYTERGGRITVTARREGGEAVLAVADTGVGMAPDLVPRVFDLFVQADHSAARSQGGLGIGLTLVRNLVELHGGTVEARSAGVGGGSEFVVRLPLAPGEGTVPLEEGGGRPEAALPRRLLVVDDNKDAADSLAEWLRLQGHEVRVAHDGPSALELAAGYRPELVFLDIGLPGMDGYEVARRLRRLPGLGGIRLAALTGWGQQEDRRRSAEAGIDHHYTKPADPVEIARLLEDLDPPNRPPAGA